MDRCTVFVMGKVHVGPLKAITIPCMELTAAVVASRRDKLEGRSCKYHFRSQYFIFYISEMKPQNICGKSAMVKRYGVIFTCLALRAIYLELASSLDTDYIVNTLKWFTVRQGQVRWWSCVPIIAQTLSALNKS